MATKQLEETLTGSESLKHHFTQGSSYHITNSLSVEIRKFVKKSKKRQGTLLGSETIDLSELSTTVRGHLA